MNPKEAAEAVKADECAGFVRGRLAKRMCWQPDETEFIVDMLEMVSVKVDAATVDSWSLLHRAMAAEWAERCHLRASDNPVSVPPKPAFLPEFDSTHPLEALQ